MPLDYEYLMGLPPIETSQTLTVRDTILYALGVGVAADNPCDPAELQFVFEDGLKALPTMVTVLAHPGLWPREPKYRLTWQKALLGEQSIEIHSPVPIEGRVHGITTIDAIYDKGAAKGAVLHSTRRIFLDGSNAPIATVRQSYFLRGDGGFGGSSTGAPLPYALPSRDADRIFAVRTQPNQALLYRLSGDYNTLHVDPKVACDAGFAAPILQGLATYGTVGSALMRLDGTIAPERVRRLDVRFSMPVYPGETLAVEVWYERRGRLGFRARVPERGVTVLQNGLMEFSHT